MLKIKTFFLLLFSFLCIFFMILFFIINEEYIDNITKSTYEQKLKTLHDTLNFGLLKEINQDNILDFALQTRADFIIKKENKIISSLKDYSFFIDKFNTQLSNTHFNKKIIYYQSYAYEDFRYIIIVYPKDVKTEFWIQNAFIFVIFLLVLSFTFIFIYKTFKEYFQELLNFIKNINLESTFTFKKIFFKDLNLINTFLLKIKNHIHKQNSQNKKQAKKIKTKNEQLSNLISVISHELKNPLSVINLSLESLKNNQNSPTQTYLIDKIQKQSFKINQLTHKLNFAFNLNSINKEKFDLFKLSQEIVNSFNETRIHIDGEKSEVFADIFLIEHVIINLINNALKYSSKDIYIQIKNCEFIIKDEGIGIEEKHLKLITKKFYKINPSHSNSFGLGLFLVKKILSLHNSALQIKSTPNKESTFSFKLTL
ncbi:sensor histidine kinase [Campylobacter insulaenigrae]|uniref:sensor histidine kinase n=1 Tax=Campylobacter insulaenigrae TaxID=260714 RepID=UPI0021520810|nr:HAMP domain-containing sensor histidine kinase [Campylobacter insulaenigrae]MCR6577518.1 HAMP domain-containing histidine kinase [Campylobacter insulaenigrae]MCR6579116.1 HAMP domain-containing histidine kinase [Campylobacter insulaenigrae]